MTQPEFVVDKKQRLKKPNSLIQNNAFSRCIENNFRIPSATFVSQQFPDELKQSITKLRSQIRQIESSQSRMLACNLLFRTVNDEHQKRSILLALGYTSAECHSLVNSKSTPFSNAILNNNRNWIKKIQLQIEAVENQFNMPKNATHLNVEMYRIDIVGSRLLFAFDCNPSYMVKENLDYHGFIFEDSRAGWTRKLSPATINAANAVRDLLAEVEVMTR